MHPCFWNSQRRAGVALDLLNGGDGLVEAEFGDRRPWSRVAGPLEAQAVGGERGGLANLAEGSFRARLDLGGERVVGV